MPLTEKQERFVREYTLTPVAKHAAIRAGYAESSADTMGSWLLRLPAVRARLDALRAQLTTRAVASRERVLEELSALALSDARGLFRPDGSMRAPHEWDDSTAGAVAGVEVLQKRQDIGLSTEGAAVTTTENLVKVKVRSKDKALEILSKHHGIISDGVRGTTGARGSTAPLDPARIARMDDASLEQALQLAEQLTDP